MTPIDEFCKTAGLSVRIKNALLNERVEFAEQAMRMSDGVLLRLPNFGRKSLNELRHALAMLNVEKGETAIPTPNERVCYNCKFGKSGTCRIYPPRVFVVDGNPLTYWPQVDNYDFCGEFQQKTRSQFMRQMAA